MLLWTHTSSRPTGNLACLSQEITAAAAPADSKFIVGTSLSLADITLFPTFVYFLKLLEPVFGWEEGPWRNRPRLKQWFFGMMGADANDEASLLPAAKAFRRVHDELAAAIDDKIARGAVAEIQQEIKDDKYQWKF